MQGKELTVFHNTPTVNYLQAKFLQGHWRNKSNKGLSLASNVLSTVIQQNESNGGGPKSFYVIDFWREILLGLAATKYFMRISRALYAYTDMPRLRWLEMDGSSYIVLPKVVCVGEATVFDSHTKRVHIGSLSQPQLRDLGDAIAEYGAVLEARAGGLSFHKASH